MAIERTSSKIGRERSRLKAYQSGEIKIVSTGRPHLDNTLSGLLPGDIVVIGGISGSGKTFELQTVRENVMDINRNPLALEYVFLDYSFEMKLFNLILRGLNKVLKKSKKEILLEEFSEAEKALANRYIETLKDNRYFIEETPQTPEQFLTQSKDFLSLNRDKKAVFIAIDHMALFKNPSGGGGKKESIDMAVEGINMLKKEFPNVIFFLLTQLNRSILLRIADKDINAQPNRGDVFQSDTMFHIADYLYIVHNPNRLGINQYLKVNPDHYDYLDKFFWESEGLSKKVSFKTLGNIFYHVLKIREGDVVFQDIFIDEIQSENIDLYKEEQLDVAKDEVDFDDLDYNGEDKF